MAFLNIAFSRTAYNDVAPCTNPQEALFDYKTSRSGLIVNNPAGYMKTVFPGQTALLDTTSRALAYDGTSEFNIVQPIAGSPVTRMRWTGTGTAPSFRTYRVTGGAADSVVDVTRVSPTALKIENVFGTALDFTTVQIGDEVYFQASDDTFTSPFSSSVQGQSFKVVDKSNASYVTIRDQGLGIAVTDLALGADYLTAMRIFSGDGVQVGDKISFSQLANLKFDNKSSVQTVSGVSDRDVIFINPFAIPETSIPGVNSFSIYSRALNFIAVSATGPVSLKIDNSTDLIKLFEYEPGSAMFMGTIQANSVSAINDTDTPITVVAHTCSF